MVFDLIRGLLAALFVGVLPGWFWACLLAPAASRSDRAERLAYAIALSLALVPTVALVPARLLGLGVTLPVAVLSALAVFGAGLAARLLFGLPKGEEPPEVGDAAPVTLGPLPLALLAPAFVLALLVVGGWLPVGTAAPTAAILLLFAVAVRFARAPREAVQACGAGHGAPGPPRWVRVVRAVALPVVLALALFRGYGGPVLHDWPFIRGVDQYSHAVMAGQMVEVGTYEGYLIYPPGFHTTTAVVSRLSDLEPLAVFPVLAPALLALPPLALYALAKRLWGWPVGVAAALLVALCANGAYAFYEDAMYPNLVASQLLLVLSVAALVNLLQRPTVRSGLLLALPGSAVVLFHPLASLYLVLILAPVGLLFVPYLLLTDRRRGAALLFSLALLFVLAVVQAWDTYDLPRAVARLLSGGPGDSSTTGTAVEGAVGTQEPYDWHHLLGTVSVPLAVLGLPGALLMPATALRSSLTSRAPRTLSLLILLWWSLFLLVGSRTTLSGFPQRFERDLGVPLALLGGFALVAVLRSLGSPAATRSLPAALLASLAVTASGVLTLQVAAGNLRDSARPSPRVVVSPQIASAGEWLGEHNTGGNIMVTPDINQVPSRIMLAYGGYTALQSFERAQIDMARDLPPQGPEPLLDVLYVLDHPGDPRAQELIREHDVRYIVTYKRMPDREFAPYWRGFEAWPDLYKKVFENGSVVIFQPRRGT
jgi:hypothetical protein